MKKINNLIYKQFKKMKNLLFFKLNKKIVILIKNS